MPFDSRNVHDVTKLDGTRTQRVFYKKESYKNAARRRLQKQEAEAGSRNRGVGPGVRPGVVPGGWAGGLGRGLGQAWATITL